MSRLCPENGAALRSAYFTGMSDPITPEEVSRLAKATIALAEKAADEDIEGDAASFAEAAERLSGALAVTAAMKG